MAASTTYLQEVLADLPVWALTCNETSGSTVADATGNLHTGSLSGSYTLGQPPMTPGLGKSIAFSASNNGKILIPYSSSFMYANDWAIELVMKCTGNNLGQVFGWFDGTAPYYGGPAVYVNNNIANGISVRDSVAGYASVGGVTDGVFRHYLLGRRGNNIEAWVNGVLIGLASDIPVKKPTGSWVQSLMAFRDNTQGVAGSLDEAAYYTSMPSPERIAIHAARSLDRRKLAGSAKLDTGAPATVVLARRWDTHVHVAQATPDNNGTWSAYVDAGDYEVTTIGPSGYQPICHGPVTALDF